MNYTYTDYPNRAEWLKARTGIGASDAAAVLGLSPYKRNTELWDEKTGRVQPEDISGKSYVAYGTEAEAPLRELFKLDYPEYRVTHHPHRILRHKDYPFIFASLDGELEHRQKGKGVYEGKTAEILKSTQWQEWKDKIPQQYYVQCLHQLLVTGWDYTILKAQLKQILENTINIYTRHYFIERVEVQEEIKILLQHEITFWDGATKLKRPNLILPQI